MFRHNIYPKGLTARAHSILHISQAVLKKVFIRSTYSSSFPLIHSYALSRHSILLGNGMAYLPDVTITHDKTGVVLHARRLRKHYGVYSLDPNFPPVSIHMLLKVSVVVGD